MHRGNIEARLRKLENVASTARLLQFKEKMDRLTDAEVRELIPLMEEDLEGYPDPERREELAARIESILNREPF